MNAAQQLILENIAEEAAEVIQAKSKCMRFGMEDFHPEEPNKTNEQLLIEEIADLMVTVEALEIDPFIWEHHIEEHKQRKRQKLVDRHPLVYAPIFNMRPTEPNQVYDAIVEEINEHIPTKPGDISYGGVTGKKYLAVKRKNFIVWERDDEHLME